MTKCLVTGVAGFIGSHLAEKLVASGYDVAGIDSFTDFYPRRMKVSNLTRLRKEKRFSFVQGDLTTLPLRRHLKGVELVFHLAAQAGVRTSWGESFSEYVRCNISATQRLLEASRGSALRKIVFASSSAIYGDSESLPTSEDATAKPISPYGATKLAAESICRIYERNFGLPVVILRYFTVYGPRQRPDMAIHRFISSILRRKKITLFGDGGQMRDFTYVSDTVTGTVAAGESMGAGQTINLGRGEPTRVIDLIHELEEIVGVKCDLERLEAQKGDVMSTCADISRARDLLGFAPLVGLNEGLRKQLEWQRQASGLKSTI